MAKVRFSPPVELDGESWRVATEVAKALGLRDAIALVYRLSAHQRRRYAVRTAGGPQLVWMVSHDGLRFVLGRSRKLAARAVAEELGLGMVWASPIETECMRVIGAAFAHLDPRPQYAAGPYHVDLYLRSARIAVECDEIGHADKDQILDRERQTFIEEHLDCRFVRFNPQAAGFNIGDVINEIIAPRSREMQDFRFLQARLELEGVGQDLAIR